MLATISLLHPKLHWFKFQAEKTEWILNNLQLRGNCPALRLRYGKAFASLYHKPNVKLLRGRSAFNFWLRMIATVCLFCLTTHWVECHFNEKSWECENASQSKALGTSEKWKTVRLPGTTFSTQFSIRRGANLKYHEICIPKLTINSVSHFRRGYHSQLTSAKWESSAVDAGDSKPRIAC